MSRVATRLMMLIGLSLVVLTASVPAAAQSTCPLAQKDDIDRAVDAICAGANSGKVKPPADNWFDNCGAGGNEGFADTKRDFMAFARWEGNAALNFGSNVQIVARAAGQYGWDKLKQGYNYFFGPAPAKSVDRMAQADAAQARSTLQKLKDYYDAATAVIAETWRQTYESARLIYGSAKCIPWDWEFKFGCQFVQQFTIGAAPLEKIATAANAVQKAQFIREAAAGIVRKTGVVDALGRLPIAERLRALREAGRAKAAAVAAAAARVKVPARLAAVLPSGRLLRPREEFIGAYERKVITDANQNRAWIAEAKLAEEGKSSAVFFYETENASMKKMNDAIGDKSLVTAMTNLHKQLMMRALRELRVRNVGLEVLPYSDFKAFRYAFKGKIPANLEAQLEAAFLRANTDFAAQLHRLKLVRATDKPETWFKAGSGAKADNASTAARAMRDDDRIGLGRFDSPQIQNRVRGYATDIASSRTELAANSRLTPLMDTASGAGVPKRDVYELARKFEDPEKLAEALRARFGTNTVTSADAAAIQRYIGNVDRFSASLRIPVRTVVNLDAAKYGGFTADLRKVGPGGQFDLSVKTAGAATPDALIAAGRRSEEAMTVVIQNRLAAFKRIVGDIANCSGDDCVGAPLALLSMADKQQLMMKLAADPLTREIRLSFVGPDVARAVDRTMIATHGELIEKALRDQLTGVIPADRLDAMTFGIDMRSRAIGSGEVGWLAGSGGAAISATEKADIDRALADAVRAVNSKLTKGGTAASYRRRSVNYILSMAL